MPEHPTFSPLQRELMFTRNLMGEPIGGMAAQNLIDGPLNDPRVLAQLPRVVELLHRVDAINASCRAGQIHDVTALMQITQAINDWRANPQATTTPENVDSPDV